ncbi:hypothetical protein JYT22_00540 [Endomicrobium sp. AH-315-J14]|nr:hypothetical protein [Endomicrobium sp. AH-315-J14]
MTASLLFATGLEILLSLEVLSALAAAATTATAVAALAARRYRIRKLAEEELAAQEKAKAAPPPRAPTGVSIALNDVVNVTSGVGLDAGGESRWFSGVLLARVGEEVRVGLFFDGDDANHMVAAFAAPDRHLYWLERVETELAPAPPGRIELEGRLLDRSASFPAALESHGTVPLDAGASATIALYESTLGQVAVLLHKSGADGAWFGRRLEEQDYDAMGNVPQTPEAFGE